MKKLFTLLTLLVFLGGGKSWGETYKHLISSNAEASYYTANSPSHEYDDGITWSFSAKAGSSGVINNSSNKYPKFTSESTLTISGLSGTVSEIKIWAGLGQSTNTIPSSVSVGTAAFTTTATTFVYKSDFSAETSYITYTGTGSAGDITIVLPTFSNGIYFAGVEITYTAKTISTQAFAGVKEGSTTLTKNTDYTVAENVITLTNIHKATSAPENIKLINHITYTDASTKDEDVDVTLSKNGDYFEGTATIGTTEYTVKVPVDKTPTLTLSTATGSIELKSYEVTGTAKVTLTGANLANGTFTAPTASGVTVTPATVEITNGTINKEFTITSTATTVAETVLAFAYTGATTKNYTLNYSKTAQRSVSQIEIDATTTWNWSNAGSSTIQLNANTNPTKDAQFLMSNLAEINKNDDFKSNALVISCEYPYRDGYTQAKSISFVTTVPGTIEVEFCNTGGSRPYRYLYVNGNATTFKSNSSTKVTATNIKVPAGEVVLSGYIPDASDPQERDGDVVGETYLRIYKIVFTPLTGGDVVAMNEYEWATYVPSADVDFTGSDVKAYIVTGHTDNAINKTQVNKVEAGTPVLLNAPKGSYEIPALAGAADATTGNYLYAGTGSSISAEAGKTKYVLSVSAGAAQFQKIVSTAATVPTGKAYLEFDEEIAAREFLDIDIDGVSTGIKNMKVGTEDNVYYDLQGRRVLYPTKGLYIVNGKKVIVK